MIHNDRPEFKSQQLPQRREHVPFNASKDVGKNADNTFSLSGSIRDEYCKGRNKIHLHAFARVHVDTPIAGDFCLLLNAAVKGPFKKFLSSPARDRRNSTPTRGNRYEQPSVLVDVLQLLKNPERMRGGVIPSMIRLQSIDDCLRFSADMLDFPHSSTLEPKLAAENRKGDLNRFRIRQGKPVLKSKRMNQMIKGRTEIVETISKDLRNNRWRRTNKFTADDIIASIRVDLIGDRVRATFNPLIALRPQQIQVI